MKTPKQMAEEYADDWHKDCDYPAEILRNTKKATETVFLAGYQAGFEIGCMKGSMAMQWTLHDDYHFTPTIDHEKLAKVMTKKEIENE